MTMSRLFLLMAGLDSTNVEWCESLTANDNELVFQVDEQLIKRDLFGSNASTTYHPTSAYSVYINDELTDQLYNSISCNKGSIVKIVANDVDSFPLFVNSYGLPIACIARLPYMTTTSGQGVTIINSMLMFSRIKALPADLFANNPQITTLDGTFQHSKIESIPPTLLETLVDLRDMDAPFWGCEEIKSIPDNLFATNYKLSYAYGCFAYSGIVEIPENLLQSNTKMSSCSSMFAGTDITMIPSKLFASCSSLSNVSCCFEECKHLQTIPSDLFASCTNLKYIGRSYTQTSTGENRIYHGVFDGCTSITTVPEQLFANNTKVEDFNGCFNSCTSLTSIPENLFVNNVAVTSFHSTFYGCSSLSGRVKIGSSIVTEASKFCDGAGAITVVVPAGSTTETAFRAYAATVTNLTVETY